MKIDSAALALRVALELGKAAMAGVGPVVFAKNSQTVDRIERTTDRREEPSMQAQDLMTRDVTTANPEETVQDAARRMTELDVGILPVSENDKLIGMITDRDIAVRGIAEGKGPKAKVRDVMTPEVKYCFADQDVDEIASNMADIQVRRLPVVNRDKRLVGILSLGDIATSDEPECAAEALSGISRPSSGIPQYAA
jgi:CBS domain-containing protein